MLPERKSVSDYNTQSTKTAKKIGERAPVRRRLESIVPAIWNLCDANAAMFATIAKFKQENISGMTHAPLKRVLETKKTESRSNMPIKSGAWYVEEAY
jgi:hypothetical protein